jgi:hypothetical protein
VGWLVGSYFLLFAYGGIYVDLDMEALVSLDEYLLRTFYNASAFGGPAVAGQGGASHSSSSSSFSGVILSQEPAAHAKVLYNQDRLACNAAMLSAPGHPFWCVWGEGGGRD